MNTNCKANMHYKGEWLLMLSRTGPGLETSSGQDQVLRVYGLLEKIMR